MPVDRSIAQPDVTGSATAGYEPAVVPDPSIEALREILFSRYRAQIVALEREIERLERRVTDEEAMAGLVAPALGPAIRRAVAENRDEVIEALYPLIGRLIARAVAEAIRGLARTIDARLRTAFSLRSRLRRVRGRLGGVDAGEHALRDALSCSAADVFLIHRETGLLLRHASRDPGGSPDSDLISAMLTAIRDFARDAFGAADQQLDEIQYGERRILLEAARHAYLAVVIDGIEPSSFRADMRECLMAVAHDYDPILRRYDGDPTPLAPADRLLRSLLISTP